MVMSRPVWLARRHARTDPRCQIAEGVTRHNERVYQVHVPTPIASTEAFTLQGDSMTIDMDPATNKVLSLGVNTYLEKPEDVVTLAVQMNSLPDGAIYAGQTTLEAKAKNITVAIQNSGYKPVTQ